MRGGFFYEGGVRIGDPTDDYPPHKRTPQRRSFIRGVVLLLGGGDYVYIYIYMYTERERERDIHAHVYIYIYIYIDR